VKAYRLGVQFLIIIALPVAVFVTFGSTLLIRILGGAAYLPDSAIALSIMIWSIPIGFINSVTQYALIAVGHQRFLTRAFIIGVICTAGVNLALVPRLGYLAAAIAMIPAELSLFIPFAWAVRRHVARVSWLRLCGIPVLAAAVDAGLVAGLQAVGVSLILALILGAFAYMMVLALSGIFRSPDFAVLWTHLPIKLPWQRRVPVVPSGE
jgi:O-antigen/teichoic acid export membrane protein